LFLAALDQGANGNSGAEAGFTLIEALVALAVAGISLTAIAALMAGNIRGAGRVAHHLQLSETLRAVVTERLDRAALATGNLTGETWSVDVTPLPNDSGNPRAAAWAPQDIVITVQSPSGGQLQLETVRLTRRTGSR
jgi:prepilin-type N-terminal cleavage/methylation domain-containing protein